MHWSGKPYAQIGKLPPTTYVLPHLNARRTPLGVMRRRRPHHRRHAGRRPLPCVPLVQ